MVRAERSAGSAPVHRDCSEPARTTSRSPATARLAHDMLRVAVPGCRRHTSWGSGRPACRPRMRTSGPCRLDVAGLQPERSGLLPRVHRAVRRPDAVRPRTSSRAPDPPSTGPRPPPHHAATLLEDAKAGEGETDDDRRRQDGGQHPADHRADQQAQPERADAARHDEPAAPPDQWKSCVQGRGPARARRSGSRWSTASTASRHSPHERSEGDAPQQPADPRRRQGPGQLRGPALDLARHERRAQQDAHPERRGEREVQELVAKPWMRVVVLERSPDTPAAGPSSACRRGRHSGLAAIRPSSCAANHSMIPRRSPSADHDQEQLPALLPEREASPGQRAGHAAAADGRPAGGEVAEHDLLQRRRAAPRRPITSEIREPSGAGEGRDRSGARCRRDRVRRQRRRQPSRGAGPSPPPARSAGRTPARRR